MRDACCSLSSAVVLKAGIVAVDAVRLLRLLLLSDRCVVSSQQ